LAGPPFAKWVVHDLRRTAKSLMAKCKVPRDIIERVLGHAISGVEGVYDQYDYFEEKADALERLNGMIAEIVG
jgi:integrase